MSFDLSSMIELHPDDRWFDYPTKPLRVKIRFVTTKERDEIGSQCSKIVRLPEELFKPRQEWDEAKFNKLISMKTIVDWAGMTSEVIQDLFKGAKCNLVGLPETGLPATDQTKEFMLVNCPTFANWVLQLSQNYELFNKQQKEAELENLGT